MNEFTIILVDCAVATKAAACGVLKIVRRDAKEDMLG